MGFPWQKEVRKNAYKLELTASQTTVDSGESSSSIAAAAIN